MSGYADMLTHVQRMHMVSKLSDLPPVPFKAKILHDGGKSEIKNNM